MRFALCLNIVFVIEKFRPTYAFFLGGGVLGVDFYWQNLTCGGKFLGNISNISEEMFQYSGEIGGSCSPIIWRKNYYKVNTPWLSGYRPLLSLAPIKMLKLRPCFFVSMYKPFWLGYINLKNNFKLTIEFETFFITFGS